MLYYKTNSSQNNQKKLTFNKRIKVFIHILFLSCSKLKQLTKNNDNTKILHKINNFTILYIITYILFV